MSKPDEQPVVREQAGVFPQNIVHKAITLRDVIGLEATYTKEGNTQKAEECRKKREKLEKWLRTYIEVYGGLQAVDDWLNEHDPGINRLAEISDMDWSFLTEKDV